MLKNKTFVDGLFWLALTGIISYNGLYLATGHNVFLLGVWAGASLVNAMLRFKKAHLQEKAKGAN